jgi:hypothetical protein
MGVVWRWIQEISSRCPPTIDTHARKWRVLIQLHVPSTVWPPHSLSSHLVISSHKIESRVCDAYSKPTVQENKECDCRRSCTVPFLFAAELLIFLGFSSLSQLSETASLSVIALREYAQHFLFLKDRDEARLLRGVR